MDRTCNACDRSAPDVSFDGTRKTCTSCRNKQAISKKIEKAKTLPNHQMCSGCYTPVPNEEMDGLKTCPNCRGKTARNDARPGRRDYQNRR
jgi:Zn finger protein HypA/HybF involved in hydrogenase expression